MAAIWRVASTPVMPGMFRSMTTTSGASSRTAAPRLAVRGLADHVDALLLEQVAETGPEQVVVVDEQHAGLVRSLDRAAVVGRWSWGLLHHPVQASAVNES